MAARPHPELHRAANAALVGALAAAGSLVAIGLALSVLSSGGAGAMAEIFFFAFFLGVPLAALHAFALGLPLYLLLRRRWALTADRAVLGGFAVGAAPWLLLAVLAGAGVPEMAGALGFAGLPGAIGGLVFRRMLRA